MTQVKKSQQPPAPQPPHLAAGSSQGHPAPHSTMRRGPTPVNHPPPSSGEEFNFSDLNEHLSGDEHNEQPAIQWSPSLASIEPAAGSAASTRPASPSNSAEPVVSESAMLGSCTSNSTA